MTVKRAESSLRTLLKHHGWFWHKYGDVRYCVHCKQPLPKTENVPDFGVGFVYTYVEAKNSDASGTWRWTEIGPGGRRANQRAWLLENAGWLFIELGVGAAPKGKSAYLLPFDQWVHHIEVQLDNLGMKSIRRETVRDRPGADALLKDYRLGWQNGMWVIPSNHVWWSRMWKGLLEELQKVEGIMYEH